MPDDQDPQPPDRAQDFAPKLGERKDMMQKLADRPAGGRDPDPASQEQNATREAVPGDPGRAVRRGLTQKRLW